MNNTLPRGAIIRNGRIYSGGGSDVESYNDLDDLPTVNGNTVQGAMTTSDLGINEMSAVVTNEVLIFSY